MPWNDRCHECPNCLMLEKIRATCLRALTAHIPGVADDVVDLWNTALREKPCEMPIMFKGKTHHEIAAIVTKALEEAERLTVRPDAYNKARGCVALLLERINELEGKGTDHERRELEE